MTLTLPSWVDEEWVAPDAHATDDDRMASTIQLAALNVRHGTGGPFAALIINEKGATVGIGMNLVTSQHCSILHGEMVAIITASQRLGTWNLAEHGPCTMYSTAEPCAMCMGAIPWSGVSRVVIAASDEDVRAIGFDEGAKPERWQAAYARRGIAVTEGVLREEAVLVLRSYVQSGGQMYNGTSNSSSTSGEPLP